MGKNQQDDIDDDFDDSDNEPQTSPSQPSFANGHSNGAPFSAGGMGMLDGRSMPFNDMGYGIGGGFGGGIDRFGPGMGMGMGMGMNFSGLDGHMHHHSSEGEAQRGFMNGFGNNGFLNKEKPKMEQPKKEKRQSQEQRLARQAKKLDIPQNEQITLVDWAIRGSCEVIRLVLEHIKIPYKEEKYVYKTKDKWFKEDRTKLRQKNPHIELPYLKDGERIVCGTEAIIIYILHKYNRTQLLGTTPEEKVMLASVFEMYSDLLEDYYTLCYGQYEEGLEWTDARDKFLNQNFKINVLRMVSTMNRGIAVRKAKDKQEKQKAEKEKERIKKENAEKGIEQEKFQDMSEERKKEVEQEIKKKKYQKRFGTDEKEEEVQYYYWIDFAIAESVSIFNVMDPRFENVTYIQNYLSKIYESAQYIVYRKSGRFHERPYNGLGAIYK